jgi:hypothetical protein
MAKQWLVFPDHESEMGNLRDFISQSTKYKFRERAFLGDVAG